MTIAEIEQLRRAAKQGVVGAQHYLGWMYYFGEGVPKDRAEATKWYRKAAEQGHDIAQRLIDRMSAPGFDPRAGA